MTASQSVLALPNHHKFPSFPIRPHSSSHCRFVIRFAPHSFHACRRDKTPDSRSFMRDAFIDSTVDQFMIIIRMCVASSASVNQMNRNALLLNHLRSDAVILRGDNVSVLTMR